MPDVPATLFVSHQGARVHRIGERVQVRSDKGHVLRDLPIFRLGSIVLLGNVEITNAALSRCFREGIDVVLLTQEGRFKGRLGALSLDDARLRLVQYRTHLDTARALDLARPMVRAKVQNGRVLLMRRQRRARDIRTPSIPPPPAVLDLAGAVQGIAILSSRIPGARDIDELRGLEGSCARYHFDGLRACLKQDIGFERRTRRPPKDPVNALLSFGYTLLFHEVLAAVRRQGLDPYLGHLHALENNRPSLVLDLMEELRPILVDSVVVQLINDITFTARDFVAGDAGAVSMKPRTLALFVKALHDRLALPIVHRGSGRSVPLREAIVLQAAHYKDVLAERATRYLPLEIR